MRKNKAMDWQRGLAAEQQAALMLEQQGYVIIAQRLRTPYGEIDILAALARCLVVVEVKARRTAADGMYAVSRRQQKRLMQAVLWFQVDQPAYADHDIRFDCIVALPDATFYHSPDAWQADLQGV